ncbi:MAG TPA: hypothetical protein VFP12_14705 [Allosphingosinicella sp.]|nr:hypothetical protein [Allosphingosinicella sp.]
MTVAREYQDLTTEAGSRREWIRPAVQQLAAGSAEDSSGPATDAIFNPS